MRKTTGDDVFGVTLPLLTTASGEKYGKSAGNAIWLDAQKTSVVCVLHFGSLSLFVAEHSLSLSCVRMQFDFYQYFLRSDDHDVEQLLKSFTFFPVEEIHDLMHEHQKAPENRAAQKVLAESITTTMHGKEGLQSALTATSLLFGKQSGVLTADQVLRMAGDAPISTVSKADIIDRPLVDLCVRLGASKSKGAGFLYASNAVDTRHLFVLL